MYFTKMRQSLAPPIFEGDSEKTRRASLLHTVTLSSIIIVALLIFIFSFFIFQSFSIRTVPHIILLIVLFIIYYLNKQGHIKTGAILLLCGYWIGGTYSLYNYGGIQLSSSVIYIFIPLMAGLILGAKWGGGIAVITILTALGLVIAEKNGRISSTTMTSSLEETFIVLVAAISIIFILFYLNDVQVTKALAIATHKEQELAKSNQMLHLEVANRMQAEAEVLFNEIRYRDLIESLDIALCRWQPDTTLTYINEKYAQLFGIESLSPPQKWMNFVPEDVREETAVYIQHLLKTDEASTYEHPVLLKDNTQRHYQWIDTPIKNQHGTIIEYQSLGIDVTKRKQAEETLEKSEAKFRTLANASPVGIFLNDVQGNCVYLNPKCAELVGLPENEILGMGWQSALHPDDIETVAENWQNSIRAKKIFRQEYRWLHKDGSIITTLGIVIPTIGPNKQSGDFIGTLVDITEQKRANDALKKSQAGLERAINTAQLGTWTLNPETGEGMWSPLMFKLFDRDPSLGRPTFQAFKEKIHPEDFQSFLDAHNKALAVDGIITNEYRYQPTSEKTKHFYGYTNRELTENGTVMLEGTLQDITGIKEAEEILRKHQERLEKAVADRTSELRQMVNLMNGRELRMSELKIVIEQLRTQLFEAGITPIANDPLITPDTNGHAQ